MIKVLPKFSWLILCTGKAARCLDHFTSGNGLKEEGIRRKRSRPETAYYPSKIQVNLKGSLATTFTTEGENHSFLAGLGFTAASKG